jgi:hypothetical protein
VTLQLQAQGRGSIWPGALTRLAVATLIAALVVAACGASGGGPSGSRGAQVESPLVGTWQMTVSRDDLQGAGISDPGLLNENAGRFTRTFRADGTWTSAQESLDGSPIHNPAWRGTYTIEGDEMRVQIEFPTEYQGMERYRWTIQESELRLTMLEPTDDPIARLGAEAHPWTRTAP